MSADALRRAAALMRERADLPYVKDEWERRGTFVVKRSRSPRIGYPAHAEGRICLDDPEDAQVASEAVAEHVASWDPTVAHAVADWLDREASKYAHWLPEAVALAHAYLNEEAS